MKSTYWLPAKLLLLLLLLLLFIVIITKNIGLDELAKGEKNLYFSRKIFNLIFSENASSQVSSRRILYKTFQSGRPE